ncbi:hypothetical protein DDD_2555 [Nonlabens dokdonensis DSW-6]|uniref:Uncharacterized protein n=1 Tax=Nonlabens dokdonensis (strain DSM 17205 / KCTC 12402 / DSW-6) TaxID=592029 RepID=L7WBS7_NONDD|nr:hypothetical protein DDD_2555 [Nonlabens dokdonensis DSW-6]
MQVLFIVFIFSLIGLILYTIQMIKKVQKMRSSGSTSFKDKCYYKYYLKYFINNMPN